MRLLNRHKSSYFGIDYNYEPDIMMWFGTDFKELFEKNYKKYPNDESLKYYQENPIEYISNNYGFRTTDDFNDTDEGNVFLGCSFTFGLGLHLEDTWAYKVNKTIGGKFWNLSLPGCGMDESFRYLYEFKDSTTKDIQERIIHMNKHDNLIIEPRKTLSNDFQDILKQCLLFICLCIYKRSSFQEEFEFMARHFVCRHYELRYWHSNAEVDKVNL